MATIKAIDGRAVYQIQSGQVIIDICSVVKELVENSLDAGATTIDVRFKNQGLEAIEIHDNGSGILPQNYEAIALKHHTSKLSRFSDLLNLKTFGFRGEALSSLCALAQVSIVTCLSQDVPKGTRLEFDASGKLKEKKVVAAQKGTTVFVHSIFKNLPVRRREIERNIRREWSKVTSILGQYACIQVGVKFSVTQQAEKGKRSIIFSTKGNNCFKENIMNIFGARILSTLIPMDLDINVGKIKDSSQEQKICQRKTLSNIRILGHMSRPTSVEGRQTPDRQMFSINSRPCHLPQIARTFNEVFKSVSGSSNPFIFANITLDTHLYDVNVTPDKRTILLHDQSKIIEALRLKISELLESRETLIPLSNFSIKNAANFKQSQITYNTHKGKTCSEGPDTYLGSTARDHNYIDNLISENDVNHNESYPKSHILGDDESSLLLHELRSQENENKNPKSSEDKITEEAFVRSSEQKFSQSQRDDFHARASENWNDIIHSSCSPILKRTNDHSFLDEDLLGEPDSKKVCKFNANDTDSEDLHLPLASSKSTISHSTKFSINSLGQKQHKEIATITIGNNITTNPIRISSPSRKHYDIDSLPLIQDKNGEKASKLPRKVLSSFGQNLSKLFSASVSEDLLQTSLNSKDDLNELNYRKENSQRITQLLLPASEDTSETDCENSEALLSPSSSIATMVDVETCDTSHVEDVNYSDQDSKKTKEEARVQELIREAEILETTSSDRLRRSSSLFKGFNKSRSTLNHVQIVETDVFLIKQQLKLLKQKLSCIPRTTARTKIEELDSLAAEEKLSLKISKTDFLKMRVIGQFNLGFILVTRPSHTADNLHELHDDDDVFIIDQHASDEIYNFERLQATTIVQSQKLVVPKRLQLTALQEETVIENLKVLNDNGFIVHIDQSSDRQVGSRCEILSLPLSQETTFSLSDLEELLTILIDHPPCDDSMIPRPSKVRKMFAMRACRSSIMIGKTLTRRQMKSVVEHLGELDKPWNCPHGRPTMRHLCGLGLLDVNVWKKDVNGIDCTNWAKYLGQARISDL